MKFINNWFEFLKENKENDNIKFKFSLDKLEEHSYKKVDFYYLEYNLDKYKIQEIYNIIKNNEYRSFATFATNIHHFEELDCVLIALINYPSNRCDKRTIKRKLEEIKKYKFVDEIEFPWDLKYINFGVEFWREIILNLVNSGYKIRPMLELGIWSVENIKKVIEFFKKINIMSIMTSSGLYPEITSFEKWDEVKELIPNKCEVKVGGVLTLNDINKFLKSNVDLAGTTISLKVK